MSSCTSKIGIVPEKLIRLADYASMSLHTFARLISWSMDEHLCSGVAPLKYGVPRPADRFAMAHSASSCRNPVYPTESCPGSVLVRKSCITKAFGIGGETEDWLEKWFQPDNVSLSVLSLRARPGVSSAKRWNNLDTDQNFSRILS